MVTGREGKKKRWYNIRERRREIRHHDVFWGNRDRAPTKMSALGTFAKFPFLSLAL